MTRDPREELKRIHRAHLRNRLKERVKRAQSDPSLLAREAFELGFSLPALLEQPKLNSPAKQPQDGSNDHGRISPRRLSEQLA